MAASVTIVGSFLAALALFAVASEAAVFTVVNSAPTPCGPHRCRWAAGGSWTAASRGGSRPPRARRRRASGCTRVFNFQLLRGIFFPDGYLISYIP
jgi:hypothetical protein